MSETTTRTTGQKRKRDDAASAQSPAGGNAQRQWEHANPAHLDPNNFQNGSFYMGHPQNGYNPALMAMQATLLQNAAAMAASGSGTATPSGAHRAKDSGNADRTNFNHLKDAMSMGGVSLREEEDYQRGQIPSSSYSGDNRSRTQDFIPPQFLISLFKTVAKHHKLQGITQDVITLAGLAVEQRLRSLVEKANVASNHRWETQTEINTGNPVKKEGDEEEKERVSMYADGKTPVFDRNLRRDVGKQLLAIEKLERAEEMRIRRERKERQEQMKQSSAGASGANANEEAEGDEDAPPKKKKKRAEGPGVQAKNMSEETKKKLSNTVANAAAGFGNRYAWMNTGSTPLPRRPTANTSSAGGGPVAFGTGWGSWGTSKAKGRGKGAKGGDKERTIGMRDVLFAVEREKGHGAGRGSARGWS